MKPVSPALLALLNTRQFYKTTLFTIALVGGSTLRYTSADRAISWDGNDFSAGGSTGPYFNLNGEDSKGHWKTGLEVDSFTFGVAAGTGTVAGVPFFTAVKNGLFDGADVTIERAYSALPGEPIVGVINIFNGRVVGINPAGASKFTFTINSWIELFNMSFPRNLYQSNCMNTLGDTACGVNLAALGVNGSVLNGSSSINILATLSQLTDRFTGGKIVFTSGANNGFSRGVRSYTNAPTSSIMLLGPLPQSPGVGDTFTIYPGCDKAIGTCFTQFNNLARFRGAPFVPENSSAV
jgi:uncharacterized phage protein (TIGR02218 family)